MSHGCVNMNEPDAAELYGWFKVGDIVLVYRKQSDAGDLTQ